MHRDVSSSLLEPTECMETAEEQRVHSPPASLVPRLHMLYAKPLPHNNPLLPPAALEDNSACKTVVLQTFLFQGPTSLVCIRPQTFALLLTVHRSIWLRLYTVRDTNLNPFGSYLSVLLFGWGTLLRTPWGSLDLSLRNTAVRSLRTQNHWCRHLPISCTVACLKLQLSAN